jgi:hypothetical protein
VALYPAGKAFSENRVRTEKQIGEARSGDAKEEIIAVFTVYRGFKRDRAVRVCWGCTWGDSSVVPLDRAVRVFWGNVGCSSFSEPENHRQWRTNPFCDGKRRNSADQIGEWEEDAGAVRQHPERSSATPTACERDARIGRDRILARRNDRGIIIDYTCQ